MRISIVVLNSRYNQSNPAGYSLRAACRSLDFCQVDLVQLSINQPYSELLREIYRSRPEVIGFGVYIWNVELVRQLTRDLRQILPQVRLIWGGPEISDSGSFWLSEVAEIDFCLAGEGEGSLPQLLTALHGGGALAAIDGLTYRTSVGEICCNQTAEPLDFSALPFVYEQVEMRELANKIVYYESSRGCPYHCSFCSSARERVRFRALDSVLAELTFLAHSEIKILKFVDRTFNADRTRAVTIVRHLLTLYRADLTVHLELEPRSLSAELIEVLNDAPCGFFQVECGIQSTWAATLAAIEKRDDFAATSRSVRGLLAAGNLHVHVDLIVGLPYEDLAALRGSFQAVYDLQAHCIQLGFLKILRGSPLAEQQEQWGICAQRTAPYQVLQTNWLSYADVLYAQQAEAAIDWFYNSNLFVYTLSLVRQFSTLPMLDFFAALAAYIEDNYSGIPGLAQKYVLLGGFLAQVLPEQAAVWRDSLRWDWYCYNPTDSLPSEIRDEQRDSMQIAHLLPTLLPYFPQLEKLPQHKWRSVVRVATFDYSPLGWERTLQVCFVRSQREGILQQVHYFELGC